MLDISKATKFKTIEEIKSVAPSIFTSKAFDEVSKNYIHIPTNQIVEDMEALGWKVVDAKQVKSRKDKYKGYQKHLLVFRNTDVVINGENGDTVFPQILISNSHDGKSAFVFRAGLYRLVCENGLVVANKEFERVSIRHVGYSFEELRKTISMMVEKLPLTVDSMNKLRKIQMDEKQKEEFAKRAFKLRFNQEVKFDLNELIKPTRPEDAGSDVWSVYNVIQEKLINGGFEYTNENGKFRKGRKIKNFQQDIKLNEQLYELATEYAC